ncbi:hypothetical protein Rhopal_003819-T1 [Rhodotorula paludigena]|uniref:Uncharacterized protein n=1 Tax=Rhodotorula paludigena TaxID=86838 RepID=A0AAV5GLS0_9BASI|nr:hypothetical protein Rhopal_003819-T1 [Rhodotorula paludigena]
MSATVDAIVTGIVSTLPEGANPWPLIRRALRAQVRPNLEHFFKAQLYTCSALIALVTIVLCTCMAAKWRQGTLWLVRVHRGKAGTFIVPHYSSLWTTLAIVFFALLQGYIWQTAFYASGHWVPTSDLWRMTVWFPGVLAFWCATWSLVVSHLLYLESSGRPARTFLAKAWFVNFAALLLPAAQAVAIGVLAWQAHKRSGTFAESDFYSRVDRSVLTDFALNLRGFGDFFRWCFWAYFIYSVINEMILVLVAVLHLRELRRTMHDLSGRMHVSEEARQQVEMLERGFRGLLKITWAIVTCETAINVLFAFVAISGRRVVYDRIYSEVASLLPLWLFSVLGLPLSILFLIRIRREAPAAPALSTKDAIAHTPLPATSSTPSSITDKQARTPQEEYSMETLGSQAYRRPGSTHDTVLVGDLTDDYAPVRQHSTSPALSQGSVAHLISTPASEGSFYSSYETRQPEAAVEEGKRKKGWV